MISFGAKGVQHLLSFRDSLFLSLVCSSPRTEATVAPEEVTAGKETTLATATAGGTSPEGVEAEGRDTMDRNPSHKGVSEHVRSLR